MTTQFATMAHSATTAQWFRSVSSGTGTMSERSEIGETISRRVKELRVQRRLSLQDLADRIGCTKGHIWDLEQGRSKPFCYTGRVCSQRLGRFARVPDGPLTIVLHPEALRIACEIDALIRKAGG